MENYAITNESLVDIKFIEQHTGFKKSFIYARITSGQLCRPEKIHGRSRWRYSDVCRFRENLISSSNE